MGAAGSQTGVQTRFEAKKQAVKNRLVDCEERQSRKSKFARVAFEIGLPPEAARSSCAQAEHFGQMTVARALHAHLALSGNNLECDE